MEKNVGRSDWLIECLKERPNKKRDKEMNEEREREREQKKEDRRMEARNKEWMKGIKNGSEGRETLRKGSEWLSY